MMKSLKSIIITFMIVSNSSVLASEHNEDFTKYSIFDLMEMDISIVSNTPQKLFESAAAVSVIDREHILRSGYDSLPQLLRTIPGFYVAAINNSKWSVSSRGFPDQFSAKLLVLLDGRSIYSGLFGGVFWDAQSFTLDDIERIEVIRGPGASIWGYNSASGVVNIVTRKPQPSVEVHQASLELGSANDHNFQYRVTAEPMTKLSVAFSLASKERDSAKQALSRVDAGDFLEKMESNVYLQYRSTHQSDHRLSLGYLTAEKSTQANFPMLQPPFQSLQSSDVDFTTTYLNYRYEYRDSEHDFWKLQAIYEHNDRDGIESPIEMSTQELKFQRTMAHDHHQFSVGASIRRYDLNIQNGFIFSTTNNKQAYSHKAVYLQDEWSMADDAVLMTLGARFETGAFSDEKLQPSLRLRWRVNAQLSFWSAASIAYRVPAYAELQNRIFFAVFPDDQFRLNLLSIEGNPNLESERIKTLEVGFRKAFSKHLAVNLSVFKSHYGNLFGTVPSAPYCEGSQEQPPCHPTTFTVWPSVTQNTTYGDGKGAELALSWTFHPDWHLSASYSYLKQKFATLPQWQSKPNNDNSPSDSGYPQSQFKTSLIGKLADHWHIGSHLQYIPSTSSELTLQSISKIESRWQWDINLQWQLTDQWQISLEGQNLLESQNLEFLATDGTVPTLIERRVALEISWQF